METYLRRKREMDDVEQSLLGELTTTEKYLMTTQELMWIRGKVCLMQMHVLTPDKKKQRMNFL